MKTPLAWRNVANSKVRSLIAFCGISFAILLIFMQLGFHAAARSTATNVYDALDFDVLVVSSQYVFLARSAQFPRNRLEQILAVDGVASARPVWFGLGEIRNPETRDRWNILALGVEPGDQPFRDAALNDQLSVLKIPDNVLIDSRSRPEHGHLVPGVTSEVQHHRVRIAGRYAIGAGFIAGATLIAGRDTFLELFKDNSPGRISVGLVKIAPNASSASIAREITKRLAPVARALTRAEISHAEQTFWLDVKPLGIMFTTGVAVAFLAGAVILYQVLASEVQNRLSEYATLKALGYDDGYIYGSVLRQALIFSGLGFVPAFLLALLLYSLLRTEVMLPVAMEVGRVALVFFLTSLMCLSATLFAVRKLRMADPADLF